MEEEIQRVAKDLGLDAFQIQQNIAVNSFTVVVHERWLFHVQTKGSLPSTDAGIPNWSCTNQGSIHAKITRPWQKIAITRIIKPITGEFSLPQIDGQQMMTSESGFMEFMDSVAKQIYRSQWEEAYYKHSSTLNRQQQCCRSKQMKMSSLAEIIQCLYSCPVIDIRDGTGLNGSRTLFKASNILHVTHLHTTVHSNLVPAFCSIDADGAVYLLQPYHEHTVHNATMFSPAMLANSDAKPLFIIYQMLHAVAYCHKSGMSCGNIGLSDFVMDEKLWVQFCGPKWNDVFSFCHSRKSAPGHAQTQTVDRIPVAQSSLPDNKNDNEHVLSCAKSMDDYTHFTMESLPEVVQKWAMGQLSNYDYLMVLNHLANRQMGNPNYHPVMPWVMDFSRPDGGHRDFSKSKFRLNKGDRQLDFTYESALQLQMLGDQQSSELSPQVPHHISDVLSEITYYIYKARRTSKSLLCTHVRSVWVPNEYPSSIQRLQSWTPDECIPEFFSDPSIFKSLHSDLPDLEVPGWCIGPEDFVEKHRAVLESPYVSERLHRWIDLTFGFKLSGIAAVKAKNVCLCLVDQHTLPAKNGVVQLFNVPHPKRFTPSPYMFLDVPVIARPQMKLEAGGIVSGASQDEDVFRSEQDVSSGVDVAKSEEDDPEQDRHVAQMAQDKSSLANSVESDNTDSMEHGTESSSVRTRMQTATAEGQNSLNSFMSATDESQLIKNPIRKLPFFRPKSEVPQDLRLIRPELATIVLPDDYDPLSALNQLEAVYTFTSKATYSLPAQKQALVDTVQWQQLVARDMLAVGCTIAELFLAPKLRMQQINADLNTRWRHLQSVVKAEYHDLPRPVREVVHALLRLDKVDKKLAASPWDVAAFFQSSQNGLPPITAGLLLQPHCGLIPFPQYFVSLYQFLSELYSQKQQIDKGMPETEQSDHQAMSMVQLARHWLPKITLGISNEGRDLLLPYIQILFQDSSTAVYAALSLFNKYSSHLGPKLATEKLVTPLTHLFDSEFTSPDYLLLFQHSFLSQAIMCLGLKPFLLKLVGFLTNATNGVKQCPMFGDSCGEQTRGLTVIVSSSNSEPETETYLTDGNSLTVEEGLFGSDDGEEGIYDTEEGEVAEEVVRAEGESISDSENGNGSVDAEKTSIGDNTGDSSESNSDQVSLQEDEKNEISVNSNEDNLSISSGKLSYVEDINQKEIHPSSEQDGMLSKASESSDKQGTSPGNQSYSIGSDLTFASDIKASDTSHPRLFKKQLSSKLYQVSALVGKSLSNVACESVVWLVHRIGPSLTVCYVTPKLLTALSGCYMTPQQLLYCDVDSDMDVGVIDPLSVCIRKKAIAGDANAKPVLKCLTDIAVLYGDQFIFKQYLPFIKETVRKVQKKVASKLEGRLIGSVVLLRHILPYLADSVLMEKLQYLFGKFLHPLLDIMSCTSINFPNGSQVRAVICFKLVDILTTIALRIGREMTRDHMTDVLKRFFLCFDLASPNILHNNEYNRHSSFTDSEDMYCVIQVDTVTNQPTIGLPYGPSSKSKATDLPSDVSPTHEADSPAPRQQSLGSQAEESASIDDMKGILSDVFTPELAHAAYIPLCRLTGSIHMERILDNHEQIWALSSKYEKALSTQLSPPLIQSPLSDDGSALNSPAEDRGSWSSAVNTELSAESFVGGRSAFGGNMTVIGNRIEPTYDEEEPALSVGTNIPGEGRAVPSRDSQEAQSNQSSPRAEMNKSKRTLRGAWLNYWEQYLAREEQDDSLHFCQIKLQTFTGHSSGVKALCMMPNENTFLSSSKDKTVKIWSLRNSGDGSSKSMSQLTYHHHRKTVFAVGLLESQRLVASCDGNVHVWDPISGAAVRGYDLSKNAPSCMEVMPAPSPCLVLSTSDANVRFIDTRHGGVQHEIRVASGPLGLIRCMAVSHDGYTLGVGLSSGVVSMVDLRTGLLLGGWRAHEGEILQIKSHINHTFLTSSVDHSMTLWKEDSSRVCNFRGAVDPVHSVCLSDEQVITATSGNRIGIYTAIGPQASYSGVKLRSDAFKGVISALSIMPLSKLLLVASDSGSIFLLA